MEIKTHQEDVKKLPPRIQDFENYREFLGELYKYKKHLRSGFSYRRFSTLLGLKSPNYIQLVINGQRNLSNPMAFKIAEALKLSPLERDYFTALVQKENATTKEEIIEADKKVLRSLRQLMTQTMEQKHAQVIDEWYHMVVREMVFLKDFEPTGEYISRKLKNLITIEQAEKSMRLLLDVGLWIVEPIGRYVVKDVTLDTGNGILHRSKIENAHVENLKAWASVLKKLDVKTREFGLLHIPISNSKLTELKSRIRQFQDEIIGWLQDEKDADQIVQLGTYLIPFE